MKQKVSIAMVVAVIALGLALGIPLAQAGDNDGVGELPGLARGGVGVLPAPQGQSNSTFIDGVMFSRHDCNGGSVETPTGNVIDCPDESGLECKAGETCTCIAVAQPEGGYTAQNACLEE